MGGVEFEAGDQTGGGAEADGDVVGGGGVVAAGFPAIVPAIGAMRIGSVGFEGRGMVGLTKRRFRRRRLVWKLGGWG